MIADYLGRIGTLRAMLAALLVALIAVAPFASARVESSAWSIMVSLIAPALVPIVFMVALFDVVMARVTMADTDRRQRYGTVLWTYGLLLCALVLAWAPFYARLF